MQLDELERSLAEQFDAEQLSVYGDYLESIGDPRGELIGIDLQELDDPEHRSRLIAAWLGESVAALATRCAIDYGFVTDLLLSADDPASGPLLDGILASPAAPYLRGVSLTGGAAWLAESIGKLVARDHAWLARLSIQLTEEAIRPVIDGDLAAALVRVTPQLTELEVHGHRVLDDFAHPKLRSACVTGFDAMELSGPGAPMPALALVDLAFWPRGESPARPMLSCDRLPALRRLDLSRNEPGDLPPHYLGGDIDPFRVLERLDVIRQLRSLRIPSLRDRAGRLDKLVRSAMPALRELVIARAYEDDPHVWLPSFASIPERWPWSPADRLGARRVMMVTPDRYIHFDAAVDRLVVWLEDSFASVPPSVQDNWRALFAASGHIGKQAALDALGSLDETDQLAPWLVVRDAIADAPDGSYLAIMS